MLYVDISDQFLQKLRVQKRPIYAGEAAAISGFSVRVSHARCIECPIREKCDAHKSGASFPQELPLVIKL